MNRQNSFAMNPRDHRGNPTVCRKCRSTYHWWENCPHVTPQERSNASRKRVFYNDNSVKEDLYIALFQKVTPTSPDEVICLMGETINKAVIDSGCTKSCCGESWLEAYMETLTDDEVKNVQSKETDAVFRFGDSPSVNAIRKVLLPLKIKNVDFTLETEVVPSNVPLLLSNVNHIPMSIISLLLVKQIHCCVNRSRSSNNKATLAAAVIKTQQQWQWQQ